MVSLCVLQRTAFYRSVLRIKTFSILSVVRTVLWTSPQLDILCISAVKRHCVKNDISPFTESRATRFYAYWSS